MPPKSLTNLTKVAVIRGRMRLKDYLGIFCRYMKVTVATAYPRIAINRETRASNFPSGSAVQVLLQWLPKDPDAAAIISPKTSFRF